MKRKKNITKTSKKNFKYFKTVTKNYKWETGCIAVTAFFSKKQKNTKTQKSRAQKKNTEFFQGGT